MPEKGNLALKLILLITSGCSPDRLTYGVRTYWLNGDAIQNLNIQASAALNALV